MPRQEAAVTIANRGTKRRCPNCGGAYYDLGRTPVICPKCQTPYVETQKVPVRASRAARPEPVLPAEEPAETTGVFDEDEALDAEEIDSDILPDEEQDDEDREDRD